MTLSDYKIEKLKRAYAEWALSQDSDSHAFSIDSMHDQIDETVEKARAYDDIRYAMEMQTAIGVSDRDTLIDIDATITKCVNKYGSRGE